MVTSCAGTTIDCKTADMCSHPNGTPTSKIPVTDLSTGITYQNIYCAICHKKQYHITRWHLRIQCNKTKNRFLRSMDVRTKHGCMQTILKPHSVQLKPCSTEINRPKRGSSRMKTAKDPELGLFNFVLGSDGKEPKCSTSQVFNPLTEECLHLNCSTDQISMKGRCMDHSNAKIQQAAVCVDFHILYKIENQTPELRNEGFTSAIVEMFMNHYQIQPYNIIFPSKLFDNSSQCANTNGFSSEYKMWNVSRTQFTIDQLSIANSQKEQLKCSSIQNNSTGTMIISLKFVGLNSDHSKLNNLIYNNSGDNKQEKIQLFVISYVGDKSMNRLAGYGCVTLIKRHIVSNAWCQGYENHYFNDDFEVIKTTGMTSSTEKISGIRILSTNKTYLRSHVRYTEVVGNGTFWRNITRMASTCDELPSLRNITGVCAKVGLPASDYKLLSNRSIEVPFLKEFSNTKWPFESEVRTPIKSMFSVNEYEYIWNQMNRSATEQLTTPLLLESQAVSICLPKELFLLLIELQLWNSVNIKQSCAFLTTFGWGSSIAGLACSALSMLAMVLVLVTYSIFRKLRTLPGIYLMNLTTAVMLAQLTFMLNLLIPFNVEDENQGCFIMAVLTHYCTLCSFMWMNVMAYNSYRSFGAKLKTRLSQLKKRQLLVNSLYGWGMPAVIVLTCALIDFTYREEQLIAYGVVSTVKVFNGYNASTGNIDSIQIRYQTMSTCWIGNSTAAVVIFGVPLLYSVIVNLGLFIKTCIGE